MPTQNGPIVSREDINAQRKALGIGPLPGGDEPNYVDMAMDAATDAAKDFSAGVKDFVDDSGRVPTLLLGFLLGAGTVLITLLATRL